MTLEELIKIADKGYEDALIYAYYIQPDGGHGDGLAKFIAIELAETYDANLSDKDQGIIATKAIDAAITNCYKVRNALRNIYSPIPMYCMGVMIDE